MSREPAQSGPGAAAPGGGASARPPIRAMIVDDEPPARDRIRWLLRDQADVALVGEFEDARSAAEALRRERPDLLFLDIRLPEGDGVALLDALGADAPAHVIFVTAYQDYAVRAFDLHATDYLLKPYDPERFYDALERVRRALRSGASAAQPLAPGTTREGGPRAPERLDRIAVRTGGRILLVRVEDVEWIEAEGNYARLHLVPGAAGARAPGASPGTRVGETFLVRETMGSLEGALDPLRFARIHRSAIVNVERIRELQPLFHGEYTVVLGSGRRLTLSRGYRDRLHGRWGRAL